MGLDGISINQIRSIQDKNSNELNSIVFNPKAENTRSVSGLDKGRMVDPDKENNENQEEFEFDFNEQEENQPEDDNSAIKYDLSRTDKYSLTLDENTNEIVIKEKDSGEVIQKIDAQNLSRFVNFLSNTQGAIVNRKF